MRCRIWRDAGQPVVTGNTVVDKQRSWRRCSTTCRVRRHHHGTSCKANGDNIIRLGQVSRPTLDALADYAPEYPCLTQGMANWSPAAWTRLPRTTRCTSRWRSIPNQPSGYGPADNPAYGANNGPHCEALPNPPYSQANPGPQPAPGEVKDGGRAVRDGSSARRPATTDLTSGYSGTAAEQHLVDALAAPVMRTDAEDVPDMATLLLGPHLARDAGEPAMKIARRQDHRRRASS